MNASAVLAADDIVGFVRVERDPTGAAAEGTAHFWSIDRDVGGAHRTGDVADANQRSSAARELRQFGRQEKHLVAGSDGRCPADDCRDLVNDTAEGCDEKRSCVGGTLVVRKDRFPAPGEVRPPIDLVPTASDRDIVVSSSTSRSGTARSACMTVFRVTQSGGCGKALPVPTRRGADALRLRWSMWWSVLVIAMSEALPGHLKQVKRLTLNRVDSSCNARR